MEIKDKPNSMSVREWITKKVATDILIPENVINRLISHQFDSALEALKKFNSLEITGFGKFYYNTKKANGEIQMCIKQKDVYQKVLDDETKPEKERRQAEIMWNRLDEYYNDLIKKENATKES